MSTTYPVALDLGSSSGRSVLGSFDGARLAIEETHRFPIRFTESGGALTWDAMEVLAQVWRGIGRSDVVARSRGGSLASVGVDTWGVDYGLLDGAGRLLRPPRAYRDPRTARVESRFYARVSPEAGFAATGVEPALINTSMQLFADLTEDPELARQVHRVLLMPDLFNYFLCGQQATGFSIASTTGLMRAGAPQWDAGMLSQLGIPTTWLPAIVAEPTVLCRIPADRAGAHGVTQLVVVHAGGHDTAAAVHAVPYDGRGAAFLSCGSWSLIGVERDAPIVSPQALRAGFTNECGLDGRVLFQKNITGLWLLQETVRRWQDAGLEHNITTLVQAAREAPALACHVDPAAQEFMRPGDLPERLGAACDRVYGRRPQTPGHMVRMVLESLALAYRRSLAELEATTGEEIAVIHMVGGGARNTLLCQLTADATGRRVVAGPVEASAIGNLLAQLRATDHLDTAESARQVVRDSFDVTTYTPRGDTELWQQAAARLPVGP